MSSIRDLLMWPKRRWRSAGFGVHSPFAYIFITQVLYPKSNHEHPLERQYLDLPLLERCIAFFSPEWLLIQKSENDAPTSLILPQTRISAPHTPLYSPHTLHIIGFPPDSADLRSLRNLRNPKPPKNPRLPKPPKLPPPVVIIVADISGKNRAFWQRLLAEAGRGMDFSDGRIGVLCRFDPLPRYSFSVLISR